MHNTGGMLCPLRLTTMGGVIVCGINISYILRVGKLHWADNYAKLPKE